MIEIEKISKTNAFKNMSISKSQLSYYAENDSHPNIIKLVELNNKTFGEKMQKMIMEYLKLDKSNNSGYDIHDKLNNLKFEVKSSRYWVATQDWKWQHIMENHDYDYLLLCGINFKSVDVYIISKKDFLNLKKIGVVKQQGGAEGQGLWANFKNIKTHLTSIENINDINSYVS
jgi:hypothetical protein